MYPAAFRFRHHPGSVRFRWGQQIAVINNDGKDDLVIVGVFVTNLDGIVDVKEDLNLVCSGSVRCFPSPFDQTERILVQAAIVCGADLRSSANATIDVAAE